MQRELRVVSYLAWNQSVKCASTSHLHYLIHRFIADFSLEFAIASKGITNESSYDTAKSMVEMRIRQQFFECLFLS
jgi:hypothetical protein